MKFLNKTVKCISSFLILIFIINPATINAQNLKPKDFDPRKKDLMKQFEFPFCRLCLKASTFINGKVEFNF